MAVLPSCCYGSTLRGKVFLGAEYNEYGVLETRKSSGWNANFGSVFGGSGISMPTSCIDSAGNYHLGGALLELGATELTITPTFRTFPTPNLRNNLGGQLCNREEIQTIDLAGTVTCVNDTAYNLLLGLTNASTTTTGSVIDTIVIEAGTILDFDNGARFMPFRDIATNGTVSITWGGSFATAGTGGGLPVSGTDFVVDQGGTGITWIKQGITNIAADSTITVTYTRRANVQVAQMYGKAQTECSLMFDGMYGNDQRMQLIIPRITVSVSEFKFNSENKIDMPFKATVQAIQTANNLSPIQLINAPA